MPLSLQVLRYSALGAGIFYGLYHQAKLSSAAKLAAINREYEHKQQLIDKAKAEYTKSKLPASAKTESGGSTFLLDPIRSFLSTEHGDCRIHRILDSLRSSGFFYWILLGALLMVFKQL